VNNSAFDSKLVYADRRSMEQTRDRDKIGHPHLLTAHAMLTAMSKHLMRPSRSTDA
jgi:hypothetical protein